jgi:Spy/CpxP family protein refolding chaperone
MRKKIIVAGVAVAAVLSLAVAGWAIERSSWGRMSAWRGHEDMAARALALLDNDHFRAAMNLTDQQASRLRGIVVATEKSSIKTKAAMEVDGIDLREMLRADHPDRDAVLGKVQEITTLRGELMKEHIEALLEAKSVLTPEQQKKLREFFESHHGHGFMHGPFMEHHGMPGPHEAPAMPPKPPAD